MSNQKRPIQAEDLYHAQQLADPQLSPNGEHIIFTVQRVDRKTEKKYTNLWLVSSDGSTKARQFTYGDHVDRSPRWSPNGQEIAFLSNRRDAKQFQIYIIPFLGGEARPVTTMVGSFASIAWSPDGSQFACQFRKKDEEAVERDKDPQKKELGIVTRHITSVTYKGDAQGYLPKEKWHVWTVDAAMGEAKQLTDGDKDETAVCWHPNGEQLLFVSNRHDEQAFNPEGTEFYVIPAHGGDMVQLEARSGRKAMPSISPDGQQIAYIGTEQKGHWGQNASLFVMPFAGGDARNLTGHADLHVSTVTNSDIGGPSGFSGPVWSKDSDKIYFQVSTKADQPLLAVNTTAAAPTIETIVHDTGIVGSFTLDEQQQKVTYFWGELLDFGQIRVHDLSSQTTQVLTNFNRDWMDEIELGTIEEVWIKGSDDNDLHGWILKPPGFDPNKTYPSILEIHGGPQTQYGNNFIHEFHFLAASGYVVSWSNPRGSQGYGEDHSEAIRNCWGTVDYADVMAWADYVEKQPYIDSDRMGVTGGSYGGYMTTMIIGRTNRFKAAVAQRLVSNFISFYGSSDMNWAVQHLFGSETDPWNDLENYWKQSPISFIGGATTPTLIVHSEMDYRCDREQGEQVFVALKRLGVDTEMLLVPGESHGLSRMGRTDRRIARLSHILRWFEKYLK